MIEELDAELTAAGLRGTLGRTTGTPTGGEGQDQAARARRSRSTRRRQDTPDLPRRRVSARTTGKLYRAPDGRAYRPSMFLTLTCDSYGRVRDDGTPVNPATYDYHRAARDAVHFPALFDRLIQNLRRYLGYDVQYFATIEPQRRLAPHVHIAFRGAISRTDLRKVIAATYHQVWWPSTETVRFGQDQLPEWHEPTGRYIDPATGELLPSWDEALDAIGPADEPLHVARFGPTFDAQGVLAGTPDSVRCIGYLTKYLTKHIAGCHTNRHRRRAGTRPAANRRTALRAVLPIVRELAALRHHPPQPPVRADPGPVQGQSPPAREPRLRRAPRPGLPQMVRQDPGRSPRRPQNLAPGHPRHPRPRHRTRPLPVGARHPRRP